MRKLTKYIFHQVKICCLHTQIFISIMGKGLYGRRIWAKADKIDHKFSMITLRRTFGKCWTIRCLAGRMAMHACQIGLTDTAPPCPGSPQRACVETKGGNALGQATFLPPFLLCYSSVRTVRLHSLFVLGSIRISGSQA